MLTAADGRMLAAYERTFGSGLETLPWTSPGAARASLSTDARTRLVAFERQLRTTWQSARPHIAATTALAALDPWSRVALYPGAPAGGPPWFGHSMGGLVTDVPIPNQAELAGVRSYSFRRRSTVFADEPILLAPLLRATAKIIGVEKVLLPLDALQQLRMVLYRNGRASLFVGLYRSKVDRVFGTEEHALLLAARPALRTWLRVAHAIGIRPVGDGALVTLLDAIGGPALLVRNERVVYANAYGIPLLASTSQWLAARRPPGFATTTMLAPDGLTFELVLPRAPAPRPLPSLPPALARVAILLARGEADKDIAAELAMPLATVRTYTARVFERLGVHGRRELMTRFGS